MKTAFDLIINWKWSAPLPVHLPGFRHALKRAWVEQFGAECPDCSCIMKLGKAYRQRHDFATIDHILARALNGTDTLDNLRVICRKCNGRKSKEESRLAQADPYHIPFAYRPGAYGIP